MSAEMELARKSARLKEIRVGTFPFTANEQDNNHGRRTDCRTTNYKVSSDPCYKNIATSKNQNAGRKVDQESENTHSKPPTRKHRRKLSTPQKLFMQPNPLVQVPPPPRNIHDSNTEFDHNDGHNEQDQADKNDRHEPRNHNETEKDLQPNNDVPYKHTLTFDDKLELYMIYFKTLNAPGRWLVPIDKDESNPKNRLLPCRYHCGRFFKTYKSHNIHVKSLHINPTGDKKLPKRCFNEIFSRTVKLLFTESTNCTFNKSQSIKPKKVASRRSSRLRALENQQAK